MDKIKAALRYPFANWQRMIYWYLNGFSLIGVLMIVVGFYGGMIGGAIPEAPGTGLFLAGMLIMIAGIFPMIAFMGYELEYKGQILKGKDKQLPKFRNFKKLFKRGAWVLLFSLLVGVISEVFLRIPVIGWAFYILVILITPILLMQYVEKEKFENFLNVGRAWKIFTKNLGSYIAMLIRAIAVTLILLIASIPIITMIVTVPAAQFSSRYLLARWYREAKKPKL